MCAGTWLLKHFRGKKTKQTFTHTAIRSTAQSSYLRRTAKEFLTQGLPYFGTSLETKLSSTNIRPQTTDRQTCFTETGNEQENFLALFMMDTHWRHPHSSLFEDYLWPSRTKVQPDLNTYLVCFFTINCLTPKAERKCYKKGHYHPLMPSGI